jgi:hypothetical protein
MGAVCGGVQKKKNWITINDDFNQASSNNHNNNHERKVSFEELMKN